MVGAVWHAASLSQGTLPDREDDRAVLAPETENAFCEWWFVMSIRDADLDDVR